MTKEDVVNKIVDTKPLSFLQLMKRIRKISDFSVTTGTPAESSELFICNQALIVLARYYKIDYSAHYNLLKQCLNKDFYYEYYRRFYDWIISKGLVFSALEIRREKGIGTAYFRWGFAWSVTAGEKEYEFARKLNLLQEGRTKFLRAKRAGRIIKLAFKKTAEADQILSIKKVEDK